VTQILKGRGKISCRYRISAQVSRFGKRQ
jgi:hypothetical protein